MDIKLMQKNTGDRSGGWSHFTIRERISGDAWRDMELAECNRRRFRFAVVLYCAVLAAAFLMMYVQKMWMEGGWFGSVGDIFSLEFFLWHDAFTFGVFVLPPYLVLVAAVLVWIVSVYRKGTWEILRRYEWESVEKQLQAERLKVELVANVSHDLKTPLTSIVSYIELLKEEEMGDVAREYVEVLDAKAGRLKKMVEDVFELSKAASGSLEIERKPIDLEKLVCQTLGDMDDMVQKASSEVAAQLPDEPVMIESDGQKLYLVLQNLIGNALRYALPATRIDVSCQMEDGRARLRVRNTAAYEMDFTAEEVLGRFVRGDRARSTEGNGLGLAIAKEYTERCGGQLELTIDGDVFDVVLVFPVSGMPPSHGSAKRACQGALDSDGITPSHGRKHGETVRGQEGDGH